MPEQSYNINSAIKSPEVRLINEFGNQVGVYTIADALSEARDAGLDLIQVNSNVYPPIAKIASYDKLLYNQAKRNKEIKKNQRDLRVRTFNMRSSIANHDISNNARKIAKLITQKKTVRVNVKLIGREKSRRELADDVLNTLISNLDTYDVTYQIIQEPYFDKDRGVLSVAMQG